MDKLNEALAKWEMAVEMVAVGELDAPDENARFMRHETFRRLVDNVKRDGVLSSLPFCWRKPDGRYLVLSGNHRVMAAKAAGLETIPILYTWRAMTESERLGVQLSHNAIVGEDDPVLLRRLYERIEDVALKLYAGLDDKTLKLLEQVSLDPLSEVPMDWRALTLMFLPVEVERVKDCFKRARETVKADETMLARLNEADRLIEAISDATAANGISNAATGLLLVLDVFERHITDLAAGWEERETKRGVPLSTIFGSGQIAPEMARKVKRAVDRMVDAGEIKNSERWRALEKLI